MSMRIENCAFTFKCPQTWEQLSQTDEKNVRFCGQCESNVHLCNTDEEFLQHVQNRHCIAIRRQATFSRDGSSLCYDESRGKTGLWVGLADVDTYRADRIIPERQERDLRQSE